MYCDLLPPPPLPLPLPSLPLPPHSLPLPLTPCPSLQVPAAAKAGAIAPISVTLPKQNTGLGPEKTSFFQALSIGTKITRGTIEIMVSATSLKSVSLDLLTSLTFLTASVC